MVRLGSWICQTPSECNLSDMKVSKSHHENSSEGYVILREPGQRGALRRSGVPGGFIVTYCKAYRKFIGSLSGVYREFIGSLSGVCGPFIVRFIGGRSDFIGVDRGFIGALLEI